MLPRLLISISLATSLAFSFGEDGTRKTYVCPLDPSYPNFVMGQIKLEDMTTYDDAKVCARACVRNDECTLIEARPTPYVLMHHKDGKIFAENGSDTTIASVNQATALKKFTGLQILKDSGDIFFDYNVTSGSFRIEKFFQPITKNDVKKNGFSASYNGSSLSISSFDNSYSISINYSKTTLTKKKDGEKTTLTFSRRLNGVDIYTLTKMNEKGNVISTEEKSGNINLEEIAGIRRNASANYIELLDISTIDEATLQPTPLKIYLNSSTGRGEALFEATTELKNEIQLGGTTLTFVSSVTTQDPNAEFNPRYYIVKNNDFSNPNNVTNNAFQIIGRVGSDEDYYTCESNTAITEGDIDENKFSVKQKSKCDALCKVEVACLNQQEGETIALQQGCRIVESQLLQPITSSTGETMYMSKKLIIECETPQKKQVGCNKYEEVTVETPDADSLFAKVYIPEFETNFTDHDFGKATQVIGVMNAVENAGHAFTGEYNYCDRGTFLNEPNWVELGIKYAMSITMGTIQAVQQGKEIVDKVMKAGLNASGGYDAMIKAMEECASQIAKEMTAKVVQNIAVQVGSQMVSTIAGKIYETVTKEDEEQAMSNTMANVTQGVSTNPDGSVEVSDAEADAIARKYATCMQRLGMDYQTIMQWQMGVENERTIMLTHSYTNPLLVTPQELYMVREVSANKEATNEADYYAYFDNHFTVKDNGGINEAGDQLLQLMPLTAQDRVFASETICGGEDQLNIIRKKYGEFFLSNSRPETPESIAKKQGVSPTVEVLPDAGYTEDTEGGGKSEASIIQDAVLGTVDAINSATPFPFNLIGMVLSDVMRVFSFGNTCDDLTFAEERNVPEYIKTNKRKNDGLCVYVGKERTLGTGDVPMQWREKYCCYDQHTTKAFALGITQQMGITLNENNCAVAISIDTLKNASFSPCEEGQDPQRDHCFPRDQFDNLANSFINGANIGIDSLINNIISDMFNIEKEVSSQKTEVSEKQP